MEQVKQNEWREQWSLLQDNEKFLFEEWILPNTIKDFEGKDVLECGCGGGQHTTFIAPVAKVVTAVDLNTVEIAKDRTKAFRNINFVEADIAKMDLDKKFDVVFSIGVVHHTDNPDQTVANLAKHVKPGGKLILWVYSEEGNFLVKYGVEPFRKIFLKNLSRESLLTISKIITALIYIPIYTVYYLPFRFLPFYEYFQNFRRMSFYRNMLNVFDKLNAPQVDFISRKRATDWVSGDCFETATVSAYKGVSWRISGVMKPQAH